VVKLVAQEVMTALEFQEKPKYIIYLPAGALDMDEIDEFEAGLVEKFGGFTRPTAKGGYKNEAGEVEVETVWVYEIITESDEDAKIGEIAAYIKEKGQQEKVLVEKTTTRCSFI